MAQTHQEDRVFHPSALLNSLVVLTHGRVAPIYAGAIESFNVPPLPNDECSNSQYQQVEVDVSAPPVDITTPIEGDSGDNTTPTDGDDGDNTTGNGGTPPDQDTSDPLEVALANINITQLITGVTEVSDQTTAVPSGGTAPYTYAWSYAEVTTSPSALFGAALGDTFTLATTSRGEEYKTGTIEVTVTDAAGATTSATAAYTITITDNIAELSGSVPNASSLTTIAPATATTRVVPAIFGGTPPYTFTWVLNRLAGDGIGLFATPIAVGDSSEYAISLTEIGYQAGEVLLTVTDTSSPTKEFNYTSTFEMRVSELLVVDINNIADEITGNAVTPEVAMGVSAVGLQGGNAPYTYSWTITPTDGTDGSDIIVDPPQADASSLMLSLSSIGALRTGTIEVTVTDNTGQTVVKESTYSLNVTIEQMDVSIADAIIDTQGDGVTLLSPNVNAVATIVGGIAPYTHFWTVLATGGTELSDMIATPSNGIDAWIPGDDATINFGIVPVAEGRIEADLSLVVVDSRGVPFATIATEARLEVEVLSVPPETPTGFFSEFIESGAYRPMNGQALDGRFVVPAGPTFGYKGSGPKIANKHYFEVQFPHQPITNPSGQDYVFGIATDTVDMATSPFEVSNTGTYVLVQYAPYTANLFQIIKVVNGISEFLYQGGVAVEDLVLSFSANLFTNKLRIYADYYGLIDVEVDLPAGQTWTPFMQGLGTNTTNDSSFAYTFNFGQAAFAYPVPTGYNSGWITPIPAANVPTVGTPTAFDPVALAGDRITLNDSDRTVSIGTNTDITFPQHVTTTEGQTSGIQYFEATILKRPQQATELGAQITEGDTEIGLCTGSWNLEQAINSVFHTAGEAVCLRAGRANDELYFGSVRLITVRGGANAVYDANKRSVLTSIQPDVAGTDVREGFYVGQVIGFLVDATRGQIKITIDGQPLTNTITHDGANSEVIEPIISYDPAIKMYPYIRTLDKALEVAFNFGQGIFTYPPDITHNQGFLEEQG